MGCNTIYNELLQAQGYDINTAASPAFDFLFNEFTQSFSDTKKYKGFRLIPVFSPADVKTRIRL